MSHWRDELRSRLASLELRPEREAEIVEELSQHLDDRVHELESGGASADQARRAALADLDTPGALAGKLAEIEARRPLVLPPPGQPARGRWLAALWQDTRHAIASLCRTPGFALTVIGALALTIGPITAILSVADWLIWRPPPGVVEPDRLAVLWFGEWRDVDGGVGVSIRSGVSDANVADLLEGSATLERMAGWQETSASFTVPGERPRHIGVGHSTTNYFGLLGVRPVAGRDFSADDDAPPYGAPVAIVSYGLARRAFGGAQQAVGQAVILNGRRLTVVGVAPAGFAGASPTSHVDVWIPSWTYYLVNHFSERSARSRGGRSGGAFHTFIVRLKPEVTFDQLRAELDVRVPALATRYPDDNGAFEAMRARVFEGLGPSELQRAGYTRTVWNLVVLGGVLLALGCANVANLLISRGVRRQRERALRVALGASRWRLAQLLLAESCALAFAGAGAGIALAFWLRRVIQNWMLPGLENAGVDLAVPIDGRVLLMTLVVSVACGLAAGVAPAWLGSNRPAVRGSAADGVKSRHGRHGLRAGFAALQFALSVALVTNALLLVGTLRHLAGVDLGFDPVGVTVHAVDPSSHGYDLQQSADYDRHLLERISRDPAFGQASLSSTYPFGSWFRTSLEPPDDAGATALQVSTNFVTPEYFRTLGMSFLSGRTFETDEMIAMTGQDGTAVVLDGALARRLFGDADPIGRSVRVPAEGSTRAYSLTVIGVTAPARRSSLLGDADNVMFLPFGAGGGYAVTRPKLLIRSRMSLPDIEARVESHASALDPTLPLERPRRLTDAVARETSDQSLLASVLTLLGGVGLALAALGLYGMLAQMVGERRREFGIRLAIGADRHHVFGLVLRQATWIAAFGGTGGLVLAWLGTALIEAELVGVTPLEPWVYLSALAVLAAVVFAAATWPARTATRIEPVIALRME